MDRVQIHVRAPGAKDTSNRAIDLTRGAPQTDAERSLTAEKERIAKALHDDVLQAFAVCLLKAQLCQRLCGRKEYELIERELSLLEDALNETIDKVRDLTATLKQPHSDSI